jgi:hypothetical protein
MKKRLTALAIAIGLLLTGCSGVDTALTLGDLKITSSQVQTSVDTILEERAKVDTTQMQLETGEALIRNQLQFQLLILGFDAIAKERKIEITNSQVESRRASIVTDVGGEDSLPNALVQASIAPADLNPYLRATLITEQLAKALTATGVAEADVQLRVQELFVAKVNELKVIVNPRYGKWDATTAQVVAGDVASDVVTPSNE